MFVRSLLLTLLVSTAVPFGAAQALMLDTWNID